MDAALPIAMRWLHIVSVVILLGGVFYARFTAGALDARFKPVAYAAIGGILGSGLYNFLNKAVYPPHYHMWFGIKMLLALHVFAIILVYQPERAKPRLLTGVVISGAIIVALSAVLLFFLMIRRPPRSTLVIKRCAPARRFSIYRSAARLRSRVTIVHACCTR